GEMRRERLEEKEPANQRLSPSDDQLDRFVRLEQAHDSGQHSKHAVRAARGSQICGRGLRIEAAIAGPLVRHEHGELPVEAENRRMHDGLPLTYCGVVQEIAGWEVVCAID